MTWTKSAGRFWLAIALILLVGAVLYWWTRRIADPRPGELTSSAFETVKTNLWSPVLRGFT